MQAESGTNYRIRIAMAAFISVALTPFSVHHYLNHDWYLVIGSGGVNVLLPIVAALVYRFRHDVRASRLLDVVSVTIINVGMLFVLVRLHATGIYWTYLVVLANFYLVSLRVAVALDVITIVGSLIIVYGNLPMPTFFRYAVSLPLVAVYAFLFARHVNRQRIELAKLANVDQLTRAGNRRSFDAALEEAMERGKRYGEKSSLILLDIDHFKKINDTRGHATGDEILIGVAARIRRRLRRSDGFYRYGGEEFAVLAPHTGEAQALQLAEDLRREIAREPLGPGIAISLSAGVAVVAAGETGRAWFERVDAALYQAKQNGRNRVQLASVETPETAASP